VDSAPGKARNTPTLARLAKGRSIPAGREYPLLAELSRLPLQTRVEPRPPDIRYVGALAVNYRFRLLVVQPSTVTSTR